MVEIVIDSELVCPRCGAGESHPTRNRLLIRAYKIQIGGRWYSQCLVCAGYYNADLEETPRNGHPTSGWF